MTDTRLHASARIGASLGRICLATLGGAWLAACAPLAPYNPEHLPTQQMSRIGEICHVVMGMPAGITSQSLACQESLSHSLAARRDRAAMLAARDTCAAQGLQPNTVALTHCERYAAASLLKQADFAPGDDATPPAKATKSYFSASNGEVHRRAGVACAQIGYDPTGPGYAFAKCVVDLQGYLFDADTPRWVGD